jgi:2-oxoglutarate ferredoxin oxidoreductase subunit delta
MRCRPIQDKEYIMNFWRTPFDLAVVNVIRGKVTIIEDRCKGCGYCITYCPKGILEFSERYNKKGYHPPQVTRPEDCVNCHYCEIICPDFAVFSEELPPEIIPATGKHPPAEAITATGSNRFPENDFGKQPGSDIKSHTIPADNAPRSFSGKP